MENIKLTIRNAFRRAYGVQPEEKPQWFDEFAKYYYDGKFIYEDERSEEKDNFK